MEVEVTPADLATVRFEGTVVVLTGTAGTSRVTFAGDAGAMRALLFVVAESGEARTAMVEDYQIIRIQPLPGSGGVE